MGIHIYEEQAEFHGYPVKRLCIEGYDHFSAVEETGEIAIFGDHVYASMFLTINKIDPSDGLKIKKETFSIPAELSKILWKNVKNKKRTELDE